MEPKIPNNFQDDFPDEPCWNPWEEAAKNSNHAPKPGRYCERCDRTFETTEAYHTHLKTSKLHHVCQYCKYDWHSQHALRMHLRTGHGSVYCGYCNQHFSSPEEKQKHMESKHAFCERCNTSFESEGLRRFHFAASEAHRSTYCKLCKVDFPDSDAYETHSCAGTARNPKPQPRKKSPQHDQNANENSKSEKGRKDEPAGGRGKFEKDSKSQKQDQHSGRGKFEKDSKWQEQDQQQSKSQGRKKESKFRNDQDEKAKRKERSYTAKIPPMKAPPNHYAMLGIPSNSSAEEIVKAAKIRRIQVHPDRTKRQAGLSAEALEALDTEAKNVGFAAEVLCDETLRRKYDQLYRLWYGFRN
ncbi:hypothetical protein MMC07_005888 [Pseudocyphellaria aurata]|nr:hypothetical protein [Pseudocyphellaria aurata]